MEVLVFYVGWLIAFIATLILIGVAYRQHVGWALACLFGGAIFFLIRYPREAAMPFILNVAGGLLVGIGFVAGATDPLRPVRHTFNQKFAIFSEFNDNFLKIVDEETAKEFVESRQKKLEERLKSYEDRAKKFAQDAKSDMKEIKVIQGQIERWERTKERGKREYETFLKVRGFNQARLARLQEKSARDTPNLKKVIGDIPKYGGAKEADVDYGFKDLKWVIQK